MKLWNVIIMKAKGIGLSLEMALDWPAPKSLSPEELNRGKARIPFHRLSCRPTCKTAKVK